LQYEKIIREGEKRLSTPDDVFHSILFHPKLPVDITNRIELMHKILGKPSGIPLKKTIENFKRDMHPEKELKIWEAMAVAFLEIVETYKIEATDAKAEVFKLLLGYSMGIPPTETRFASDGALFKILAPKHTNSHLLRIRRSCASQPTAEVIASLLQLIFNDLKLSLNTNIICNNI
jgi:hypothetical protein